MKKTSCSYKKWLTSTWKFLVRQNQLLESTQGCLSNTFGMIRIPTLELDNHISIWVCYTAIFNILSSLLFSWILICVECEQTLQVTQIYLGRRRQNWWLWSCNSLPLILVIVAILKIIEVVKYWCLKDLWHTVRFWFDQDVWL